MVAASSYEQAFRVIGQDLDSNRAGDFLLKRQEENFLVQAQVRAQPDEMVTDTEGKKGNWRKRLREWLAKDTKSEEDVDSKKTRWHAVDLFYTPQDIDRLESLGRQRRGLGEEKPDSQTAAEALRVIGAYLDSIRVEIVSLAKNGRLIKIELDHGKGSLRTEEHDISSFYDFSVKMYLKRKRNSV